MYDKCTCYRNWEGDDCSERTCPYALSWNTVSQVSSTMPDGNALWEHGYSECSSKGTCDRKTGLCKCFDGFTGVACRRMKCDEDCNEHGTCELISTGTSGAYVAWDAEKIQKCVCDSGWEGDKCDRKKCKKGDDPITRADFDGSSWNAQQAEVQTLTFGAVTATDSGETYTLSYTDWRGQVWETWALDAYAGTAIEIEEALEALPNEAIPSITVTTTTAFSGTGAAIFSITFDSSLNSGNQNLLTVNKAGCSTAGCQPKYAGAAGDVAITEATSGTTEWAVCSNRGTCNGDSGDCECFDGFTGEACEIQTIIT